MKEKLSAYFNNVTTLILIVVAVLTPLIFTSSTTEFYDIPKVIFISAAVLILLVLWSLYWVMRGKVLVTRTPLDLAFIFLLVVLVLSTVFNGDSRYVEIFGNFPRIHGSLISWVAYILLFFVTVSHLKSTSRIKSLILGLLVSSTIVSLISLTSYFGLFLPLSLAKVVNFTPTGSSFSAAALLVLMLPIILISILKPNRFLSLPAAMALAVLFSLTIALIGSFSTLVSAVLALVLSLVICRTEQIRKALPLLLIPLFISTLVFVAGYIPTSGSNNPFYQKRINFPREIQLPFSTSWKISASAFRDNPFLGTGPSTYLFDFTAYKPVEFNSTNFWNLRFDSAFNEYLQVLGTLGGLGLLAFLFLTGMILSFSWSEIDKADQETANPSTLIPIALSISAILVVALWLLHVTTPVLMTASLLILALLMASRKSVADKVEELTIGIKASKLADSSIIVGDILPILLFIPVLILAILAFWHGTRAVLADYNHRLALNVASTKGLETYNNLVQAENLNPWIDLYRTDLAQTNFALANAIATSKGPTEASPGGSLTDIDKQNIQQLLSQAISEGRVAASLLNPRSAQNWEILAAIYRQISGVAQNALQFSLDAYGRAIQRDPYNPLLRLNVGGVYYSAKKYDMAIRFFSDAVNLKPDFANGYYNLSIALRDKGDLQNALATAEQVVALLQKDTKNPDYKVASDYLADLKARVATGSANESGITAPAAGTQGALQNQELPKVLDLPKPDNIATPPAVKRNTRLTPVPTPTPEATPGL